MHVTPESVTGFRKWGDETNKTRGRSDLLLRESKFDLVELFDRLKFHFQLGRDFPDKIEKVLCPRGC